jgi:RNA polymerase primary sigma factor
LEGSEQRRNNAEANPYCALVRDELYSDKADSTAGGSFGLGKSVLWAFSGLKTVLFCSVPFDAPEGSSGVRFVGRVALPWHETEQDGKCTGDGWFGVPVLPGTADRHADSAWGAAAVSVSGATFCARAPSDPGLTAVIVGFSAPGEEDSGAEALRENILHSIMDSFWPALVDGRLHARVETWRNGDRQTVVAADPLAASGFSEVSGMLRAFRRGALEQRERLAPGEMTVVWVTLGLPERIVPEAHPPCQAKVAVLVRILDEGEDSPELTNRIFRFRRPGMVVRSDKASLSLGARPYVAAVLAGEAAGQDTMSVRAEQFLRAAEPPAHDEWIHDTKRMKDEYKTYGTRKLLADFEKAIREAVSKIVSVPDEEGGQLPKAILKYLRFSSVGGGGNDHYMSVTHERAFVREGRWQFRAKCRRIRATDSPWHVSVSLRYGRDGGGADALHAIGTLSADGATRTLVKNGDGLIEFPASVSSAFIEGDTEPVLMPAAGTRAVLGLRIEGCEGEIPNA